MWKAVKQVTVRPLILIGAGNLGTTLCSNYNEFEGKGLKIVAAFDHDPIKCGTQLGHIEAVEHVSAIQRVTKEHGAKIAILAIPGEKAQEITKMCIDAGISTILNYSPVSLNVPNHVHVEYMDPALKIQMALSSHRPSNTYRRYSRSRDNDYYFYFGLHFSPFPAHIGKPLTPLLTPFRKYAKLIMYKTVKPRDFSTHNRSMPAMLQSNRYLSDFLEVGILGQGGFGSVYQARNLIDGVDYAVKKIRLSINSGNLNDITDHKYLREVHAMARLNHVNLVRYYYAWMEFDDQNASDDGSGFHSCSHTPEGGTNTCNSCSSMCDTSCSFTESHIEQLSSEDPQQIDLEDPQQVNLVLYIQMELCMGVTLKDWMGRGDRAVHIQECHTILTQIAQGLHHIHTHGDVTPANIFLERFPDQIVVKIGDFGLAKYCGDIKQGIDPNTLNTIDNDKTIGVGTFLYASPEQLSNAAYDTKADMYSVGVILFELLQPFNTQMERVFSLTQLREGCVAPAISLRYPEECAIVECLLNKDPSQRPSAGAILARVQHKI